MTLGEPADRIDELQKQIWRPTRDGCGWSTTARIPSREMRAVALARPLVNDRGASSVAD